MSLPSESGVSREGKATSAIAQLLQLIPPGAALSNFTSQGPDRQRASFPKVSAHYQDDLQGDFSCLRNSERR